MSIKPYLLRSLLFVPANSWRLLMSALRTEADALVIDLEDAVPIDDKETGRWFVKEFLENEREKAADKLVFVRINGVLTGLYEEDLQFAVRKGLDGIVIPKTESKDDVSKVENVLSELESKMGLENGNIFILPLIESALGIENAYEIATASKRIIGLSFGAGDYLRDLGLSYSILSRDEHEILYPRSRLVVAAKAAGLPAIDTPFLGLIIDREGLKRQSEIARKLGFDGKYAIHPTHIDIINNVFSPSEEEISEAREIVATYEEASKRGLGAISYKGRMIDYMNYMQAKKALEIAELIRRKRESQVV